MKLWRTLLPGRSIESRYTFSDLAKAYADGNVFPAFGGSPWLKEETLDHSFIDYVQNAYKASGPVFACMAARSRIFSQARFQWSTFTGAKPGPLFGSANLALLEKPWPNGSTNELLARMIQDADLAGNAYIAREGNRLRRLRPDWVEIVLTAPPADAVESDVAGYLYRPGGMGGSGKTRIYLPDELTHWTPLPDPEAQYRGMSWMTPVVREIRSDKAATAHKLEFFNNAATPNLAVSFKETVTDEQFDEFMEAMNKAHQGTRNAYKTLYLAGGADVTVIGADLKQLDFKTVQGHGETRIANAAGVPAVIVGLSEGLAGSSLNAGNYNSARRNFADGTLQDLWVGVCAALETVAVPPALRPGAAGVNRLWFDKSQIPFLREDAKDIAEIQQTRAIALRALVDAGFNADAAVAYLEGDDLAALTGQHSGLFSVQLQPPGAGQDTNEPADPARAGRSATRHLPGKHNQDNHGDGAGSLGDKLKLAGRIKLKTGDVLAGSSKVHGNRHADRAAVLAAIDTPFGRRVRLGVVHNDDSRNWRASNLGSTLDLDEAQTQRLGQELIELRGQATQMVKDYRAAVKAEYAKQRAAGARDEADFNIDAFPDWEQITADGAIPGGAWGDLAWHVEFSERDSMLDAIEIPDVEVSVSLRVKPADADPAWQFFDETENFQDHDAASLGRLIKEIDRLGTQV